MNEFNNQKKRSAIKWVIVLTAIAILLVIVAFAIVQSVPKKVVGGELAADEGGVIIGVTEECGIKLLSETISPAAYSAYGISAQAESAKTLTATVEPSNAQNVEVDWSVSWVNAESEWATGKTVTDYVTVTPVSDGALTANLACLKAFGEQVKIICTYRSNKNVTAECTVDYSKKFLSKTLQWSLFNSTGSYFNFGELTSYKYDIMGLFALGTQGLLNEANYSECYSVDDTFVQTYTLTINPEFLGYLTAAGVTIPETQKSFVYRKADIESRLFDKYFQGGTQFFYKFDTRYASYCDFSVEVANKAVGVALQHTDIPVYTISLKAVGTYSTFEHSMDIYFGEGSLSYVVTDMALNNDNIIF